MGHTIQQLLLSSSDLVLNLKAGSKNVLAGLKAGQTLTARVMADSSPREAVLLILGQKVPVKTFTPLKSGETITVQVVLKGKETVLKMVPPQGEPPRPITKGTPLPTRQEPYRLLLDLLNSTDHPKETTEPSRLHTDRLKSLLSRIALQSGKPDKEFLVRLIRSGGITWEHKLRKQILSDHPPGAHRVKEMMTGDVKALALEHLRTTGNERRDATHPTRVFVDQIEEFQLFNKQALEETGKFFFPFPIAAEGQWRFGQLLIHLNSRDETKKKGGDGPVRVAFLLDLTRLGHLAADFSIFDRMVNGYFEVADETVRGLIEEGIPDLRARFAALGFTAAHMDCRLSGDSDPGETSFLNRVVAEDGLLNLVI